MFKYDPNTQYAFYAEDFETDLVMAYDFNADETAESYGEELCKAVLSELGLDVPEDGACEVLARHYNREDIQTRVQETYIEELKPDFEAVLKEIKNLIGGEIYMTVDYSTIRLADMVEIINNCRYGWGWDGMCLSEIVEEILHTASPDCIKIYTDDDISTKPETAVII